MNTHYLHGLSFYKYLSYHAIFCLKYISINHNIAFCNMHMQELGKKWLRSENFMLDKNLSMKSIHGLQNSFSGKIVKVKYKSFMFASRNMHVLL